MRVTQLGDHVQVHYVKRYSGGSVCSSRARGDAPLEVIVGTPHPRLPGVGAELAGLTVGASLTLSVSADAAHGQSDPARIHRVFRNRFGENQILIAGRQVRMQVGSGRTRVVRVVEIRERVVIVDLNHPRCGQSVELEVEVIAIATTAPEITHWGP